MKDSRKLIKNQEANLEPTAKIIIKLKYSGDIGEQVINIV